MVKQNTSKVKYRRIKQKYGSRKGMLYYWLYKFLYLIGFYRKFEKINWQAVDRLVFVCKGNICRSAYADVLAISQGITSTSCGLETIDGTPANSKASVVANKMGLDLSSHTATTLKSAELKDSDLLIAMEPWQVYELMDKTGDAYQYTLLGLWGTGKQPHIQDPYGLSEEYFTNCFKRIERAVNAIIQKAS